MIHKRRVFFIILIIFFSMGVSSCSTKRGVLIESEREVLIKSLPNDGSWFTEARRFALRYGKKFGRELLYIWSSKEFYINGEIQRYDIWYFTGYVEAVSLSKKSGSFQRVVVYNESGNKYFVSDNDFSKVVSERFIAKEEAEELIYNFFKELDRYGLK